MEYVRTVRVPVHYLTTRKKFSYLDRLTARLTYAVRLWSEIIESRGLQSVTDCSPFEQTVKDETGLSAGFVQQARDKALWMWISYLEQYRRWEWMLSKTKAGGKWYQKLLKREPSPPCVSKRSKPKKIPIRFDYRTGQVQKAELMLTKWVIHMSTLKKGETIDVLLKPSEYHEKLLEEGQIKGFEIVKKNGWYYIHITCVLETHTQPIQRFVGVDLGIRRSASTVSINPANLKPHDFHIFKDGKRKRLQELNDRVSHLRRLEKWEALKRLRNKRWNAAKDFDWKLAKTVAESCINSYVFLGRPRVHPLPQIPGKRRQDGKKTASELELQQTNPLHPT